MVAIIFVAGCLFLAAGYLVCGRLLERIFEVDPARPTPAVTMRDNVDYVPARPQVLFGHHFSSIAGAVPIVGPITAGAAFGWIGPLLWIALGSVLIGGVHDFAALVMSIRHRARSIAEIVKLYLSPSTYRLFLCFIWLALVYVLIVFVDLTATTFSPPVAGIEDPVRRAALIRDGGVVATASMTYVLLAVLFGLLVNTDKLSLRAGSALFVPLVFGSLLFAERFPLSQTLVPAFISRDPKNTWSVLLVAYALVASVLPVWVLLQPRDYLSSFLLFACVLGGGIGIVVTGLTNGLPVRYPAVLSLHSDKLGFVFPALFITVACGAVSGFHALVASGTTAKQLPKEASARPIAYGAMLVEATLALVALGTLMCVAKPADTPQATFAAGIAQFLAVFGLKPSIGVAFALLALSTFLLTTLDTCTRIGRYVFEELTGLRIGRMRLVSAIATLLLPTISVLIRVPDPTHPGAHQPAWQAVYPVFGSTNQLLAAFALLVVLVWRVHLRKSYLFVAIPMVFMMATTMTQLVILVMKGWGGNNALISILAAALLVIAVALMADVARSWGRITTPKSEEAVEE